MSGSIRARLIDARPRQSGRTPPPQVEQTFSNDASPAFFSEACVSTAISACAGNVREGDTVLVASMDRRGLDTCDLYAIFDELTDKGCKVALVSKDDHSRPRRSRPSAARPLT